MGNATSQAFGQKNQITHEVEHPHLGSIRVCESSIYKDCFMKVFHFGDEMMGQEKLRRFNARIKKFTNHEYILQIKSVELVSKHEMCAHNCDIILYFEKFSQTLGSILSNRLREKKNFSEKEIYVFINKVLEALIFLQDNGFKNCHLDKTSIVFCQQTVKLIDLGIATSSPYQNFLDTLQFIPGFYVAPEHLKDLKERNYEPYLSPKSDIFCLGMITLELACMEPLDSYYNYETFTLDYESLIHRVSKIVYSVELKTLIAGMLEFESDLRIGLISLQQKVRKILNFQVTEEESVAHKRSRSSSTKMLKQLLTSSRRTMTGPAHENSSLVRKSSQTSITSMASLNAKQSGSKSKIENKVRGKKQSEILLSSFEPSTLKDLVKNKIQSQKMGDTKPQLNKENHNCQLNRMTKGTRVELDNHEKENSKIIEQARRKSFGTRAFFDNPRDLEKKADPPLKTSDHWQMNNMKKQESSLKGKGEQQASEAQQFIFPNVPDNSPTTLPQFHQTNSINSQFPSSHKKPTITEFKHEKEEDKKKLLKIQYASPPLQLKVKKSLDKMYKTTQSITTSENKEYKEQKKGVEKNTFQKIKLPNNFWYEGQIKNGDTIEGNGVLYNPSGETIYQGTWIANCYDGYGTEHNLQAKQITVDMKNLCISSKNWLKYEGEFSKGMWQGFGTIFFAHGEKFTGCMKNGEVNGIGWFYDTNEQRTSGHWINNRLQP